MTTLALSEAKVAKTKRNF